MQTTTTSKMEAHRQLTELMDELKGREATPSDYSKLFEIVMKDDLDKKQVKETQLDFTFDGGTF